jgi:hypothetical protein
MKKFTLFILLLASTVLGYTQTPTFTQNFNVSGCNRANLTSQCWQFTSIDINNAGALEGSCSARSSALSNPVLNQYVMRTPVLKITTGSTMSFSHRVTNTSSSPNLTITVVEHLTNIETTIFPTFNYTNNA